MPPSLTTSYTLSDFDYELPQELVAKYPLPQRDQSRMMVLDSSGRSISHHQFFQLPQLLVPGDLLVLNNARVIPARLQGTRDGHTGRVEIFLMHPQNADRTVWQVLMKPARRLKPGTVVRFENSPLTVTVEDRLDEGRGIVSLHWPQSMTLDEVLQTTGTLPIPPYLERDTEPIDNERYQTVFAKVPGAQAAPTAGLHFTPAVLEALQAKGVGMAEITLHVSAGTFRPVLSDDITAHRMDPEYYILSPETAEAIHAAKTQGRRVIAVGTTVAKTLETVVRQHPGQLRACEGWSELFITPGFSFEAVDVLLTNFHLPRSTLMMLVSAFADRDLIMQAYHEAIRERYRFYSYGDCMLIT